MSVHLHLHFMTSLQFSHILKHFTDFKSQQLVSSVCSLEEIMDKTKSDALKKQLSVSWWKARVHTAVLSWTSRKTSCTLWDNLIIRLCPFENGPRERFKMMDISLQKQLLTDWCRLHFSRKHRLYFLLKLRYEPGLCVFCLVCHGHTLMMDFSFHKQKEHNNSFKNLYTFPHLFPGW